MSYMPGGWTYKGLRPFHAPGGDGALVAWQGVVLPALPEDVSAIIEESEGRIIVTIWTKAKKRVQFSEPLQEFPSDLMIAQIVLVV